MIAHAGRTEGVDTKNLPKRPAAIPEPVLKARGYFLYAPQTTSNAPAMAALRRWLVTPAGWPRPNFLPISRESAPTGRKSWSE